MQVRTWSEGLNIWGYIDQITEKVDPLWYFAPQVFEKRQKEDILTSMKTL
jgi:hypothetical protein